MAHTLEEPDPYRLLELENEDLLAAANLATMNTWARYEAIKPILAAEGALLDHHLPRLPRDLLDNMIVAFDQIIAWIADDAVYQYLYDDEHLDDDEEERWVALMHGDTPPDEWRMM